MRGSRWLAVVLLLSLAAIATWFALPGATPAAAVDDRSAGVAADAVGSASGGLTDVPIVRRAAEPVEVVDADDTRGDPLQVVVAVVFADGRPAPAAEVRYWSPRTRAEIRRDEQFVERTHDVEAALQATGRVVTTDVMGRVAIDADDEGKVCARLGGAYGEAAVADWADRHAGEPVRIVLRHDVALRVEVVDAGGDPCPGIALTAELYLFSRDTGERNPSLELGKTDERGRADWPHLQARAPLPDDVVLEWSLDVRCEGNHLLDEPRRVTVEEVLSGAPIRLVVPVGGEVVVTVVDAAGNPLRSRPNLEAQGDDLYCTPTEEVGRNVYSFRQVPLGRRWVVAVPTKNINRADAEVVRRELVGPTRRGESVHVGVAMPCIEWVMTGTLRRADGVALEHVTIDLTAVAVDATGVRTAVGGGLSSFREGRLTAYLRTGVVEHLSDVVLHVASEDVGWSLDIEVPGDVRPDQQDLGAVLVPVPEGEQTLAIVEVRIDGECVTAAAGVWLQTDKGDRRARVAARASYEGSNVVFRGVPPPGPLRVACSHPGSLEMSPRRIAVGERIVLELQSAAELAVAFQADGPHFFFEGKLLPIDDDGGTSREALSDERHVLTWSKLRPGRYRLVIDVASLTVFEQELPPLAAGANRWPATGSLDLRDRIAVLHVLARGTAGQKLEARCVAVDIGATELPENPGTSEDGWLAVVRRDRDFLVAAEGHVPVRVSQPAHDIDVTLTRCTKVVLEEAAGGDVAVQFEYVREGVADAALRAFARQDGERPTDLELAAGEQWDFRCAPGTELLVHIARDGRAPTTQRVVVGTISPQIVRIP